jgi:hypothetical protein
MLENYMNPTIGNLNFFYSLHEVREKLKERAIKRYEAGAFGRDYPIRGLKSLYINRWLDIRTVAIMKEAFVASEEKSMRDWNRFQEKFVNDDINSIGADAALYAWCTISDEERWDRMTDQSTALATFVRKEPKVFERVNYGLITQCYAPIYRAAQYMAGWTQVEEDMDMPPMTYKVLHDECIKFVYDNCSYPKDYVDKEIATLSMVVSSNDYY